MKRYDAVNTNGDPLYAPSPNGEMVFYSDVAAMVAMNAELVEALELANRLLFGKVANKLAFKQTVQPLLTKAKELSQ